jgi:hypothetical protein
MTIEKLEELLRSKPFHPFRVFTSDGDSFDVKSREFVWRTPGGRTVYIASGVGEQVQIIDWFLVSKVVVDGDTSRPSNPPEQESQVA